MDIVETLETFVCRTIDHDGGKLWPDVVERDERLDGVEAEIGVEAVDAQVGIFVAQSRQDIAFLGAVGAVAFIGIEIEDGNRPGIALFVNLLGENVVLDFEQGIIVLEGDNVGAVNAMSRFCGGELVVQSGKLARKNVAVHNRARRLLENFKLRFRREYVYGNLIFSVFDLGDFLIIEKTGECECHDKNAAGQEEDEEIFSTIYFFF